MFQQWNIWRPYFYVAYLLENNFQPFNQHICKQIDD